MLRLLRNNGLSIVLFVLFGLCWTGQAVAGWRHENDERQEHHRPPIAFPAYVRGPAFLEATAENWESEFLQMAAYVWLTVFLFQKGSAESKDPESSEEPVDREPDPTRTGAPHPVRHGGVLRWIYERSLVLALAMLFVGSFILHAIGGARVYAESQAEHGELPTMTVARYVRTSQFWFESLQNWQSEFLAVFMIVVLSVFLRQRGSPESKPVDARHNETGNG
jgi:hypothetical protein